MTILFLQAIIGIGTAITVPLWQEHEADFFNVARFLITRGRLPVPSDYSAGDADIRQATQPVLYFLLSAPIVGLFDDQMPVPVGVQPGLICIGGPNSADVVTLTTATYDLPPHGFPSGSALAGYALRFFGVLTAIIAVVFTYMTARRLFPAHPYGALTAAAVLAFEPTIARQSALISNDILLLAVAAANLYFVARALPAINRDKPRVLALIPVLITAALAALTRLPGWAVLAFDALVLALFLVRVVAQRVGGHQRPALMRGLIAAGIGVIVLMMLALGIGVFNLERYGSLLGRYENLDQIVLSALREFRLPVVTLIGIFDQTWHDYMNLIEALHGRAIFERLYGWLPAVFLALAAVGTVFAFIRRRADNGAALRAFALLWIATALAVGLVIIRNITSANDTNTTRYDTTFIFAPVRYFIPGLPAFALIVGVGAAITAGWLHRRLASASILIALPFLAVGVLSVVRLAAEMPTNPIVPPEMAAGLPAPEFVSGDPAFAPSIIGYEVAVRDGWLDLTLYATTAAPLDANFIGRVSIGASETGVPFSSCEFLPQNGSYPTTRWNAGDTLRIRASIPYCPRLNDPPLLDAGASIRLSWLPADLNGELIPVEMPLTIGLGETNAPLSRAPSCPPTLGIVADAYQITRFNAPPPVRRGETVVPSLNWSVTDPNPAAVARIFVFRHDQTGFETTCNSTTRYVKVWVRGENIFFDGCPMQFAPDMPTGRYTVFAGIQDAEFHWLPAIDADGNAVNFVPVGTIEVIE